MGRILLVSLCSSPGFNIAPPTGIHQLRHHLEKHGIACDVLDRDLEDPDAYVARAREGVYEVIGMSVSHVRMTVDLDMLWELRAAVADGGRPCLFAGGGQEATLNHEQWLSLGLDVVFVGFAEKSFREFCRRVLAASDSDKVPSNLPTLAEGIDGVIHPDGNGGIKFREATPLSRERFREICFDQIFEMDIPYHAYWDKVRRESADITLGAADFVIENVRVYTASHCPRKCGFCATQSFLPTAHGGHFPIIFLAAEEVVDLVLMYVDRYGARSFLFSDDDFPVGNKEGLKRLTRVCELLIGHKQSGRIPEDIRFSCQARIMDFMGRSARIGGDGVNRALLKRMAEAGFMSVGVGVETFSDRMLKAPSINKSALTVAKSRDVIDGMIEAGLVPQINIILGIPEYRPDELAETMITAVDYLLKGCDVAVVRHLWTWPGAPVIETGLYDVVSDTWVHPVTGETAMISHHLVPKDPLIQHMVEGIEEVMTEELGTVVRREGWEDKIVHKRVVCLASLIAAARLLERNDLRDQFRGVLDGVLVDPGQRSGFNPLD
jgi:radical SAM superfamily enzyme YgiQ (UPF0313 family)